MRIHSMTRLLTSFHDRLSCCCADSSRTVPISRARPSLFKGKTARKSVLSSATCSSPFIVGSARLHIGDIEEMVVHPARKADLQRFSHGGMCPVASRNVGRFAGLLGSIRPLQTRQHPTVRILE